MPETTPELRGLALRLRWDHTCGSEEEAVRRLEEQRAGFEGEQYVEAWRSAAVLDGVAFDLADAWHASKGKAPGPEVEDLELMCPGFTTADYALAIHNNLRWAAM